MSEKEIAQGTEIQEQDSSVMVVKDGITGIGGSSITPEETEKKEESIVLLEGVSVTRQGRIQKIIELLKKGHKRSDIAEIITNHYKIGQEMFNKDMQLCRKILSAMFIEQKESQAGLSLERYNDWILECDEKDAGGKYIINPRHRIEQKRLIQTRIDVITGVEKQPGDVHIEEMNVFMAFPKSIENQFTNLNPGGDIDVDFEVNNEPNQTP